MYPKLLDFNPVTMATFSMTLARPCVCPLVSDVIGWNCVHVMIGCDRLSVEGVTKCLLLQNLRLEKMLVK